MKEVAGGECVIEAARVVTDGANICFQRQVTGYWQTTLCIPAEKVERLQRWADGEQRWVPVRPRPMIEGVSRW